MFSLYYNSIHNQLCVTTKHFLMEALPYILTFFQFKHKMYEEGGIKFLVISPVLNMVES